MSAFEFSQFTLKAAWTDSSEYVSDCTQEIKKRKSNFQNFLLQKNPLRIYEVFCISIHIIEALDQF